MIKPSATKVAIFTRDVYIVTEWRDDTVYRTKKVGQIMALFSDLPFKPNSHAQLIPVSKEK
jgi:hypothetical protein